MLNMNQSDALSYKFNMSLGFIPAILSMLLCERIAPDIAIYIGLATGVLACLFFRSKKGISTPRILLHTTTGMLALLSISSVIIDKYCPHSLMTLTLEICTIFPPALIFLNKKRYLHYYDNKSRQYHRIVFKQAAEAALASSKVILILGFIHFLLISTCALIFKPIPTTVSYLLLHIIPIVIFIICILFNQFGIFYFNRIMNQTVFLPIVNTQGDVIGKTIASEAIHRKHKFIIPVIRIAITAHGMLYLKPRSAYNHFERGKNDLLVEGYLTFGETLEQGIKRLMKQMFPNVPIDNIRFNLKYHYENQATNRLIYLFLLDIQDESPLLASKGKGVKPWTFQQIEHNLSRHFFSSCFEYEYEYLKSIICTIEKYKES